MPIKPYKAINGSVLVGIGQRYHVIAVANPVNLTERNPTGDYWIRSIPADGCARFENSSVDSRVGIVRYNAKSKARPTSSVAKFPTACSDEPYDLLQPILPWTVGPPANNSKTLQWQTVTGLTMASYEWYIQCWGSSTQPSACTALAAWKSFKMGTGQCSHVVKFLRSNHQ